MQIKMKSVLAAIGLVIAPVAANATPVKISFTGTVEDITTLGISGNAALETVYSVGDAVSGSVLFDPDLAVAAGASATSASYTDAILSMAVTVAGNTFTSNGGTITSRDDNMAGSAAPFADGFFAQGRAGVAGPSAGGATPELLQFSLLSADLSAVSTLLPFGAAEIGALIAANYANGNTNFVVFDNNGTLRFGFDSLSVSEVPLPGAALLFVPAMAGLAAARRRKAKLSA